MNTMTSLAGGLAAVLALYAAGGTIRSLPPILRALLAGLLPLLGYFVLILGRWPGLGVGAMHISVFLATGLGLYAVSQFRRRSPGRMHWAPKLLVAFFLGLVVVNGSLLYIATKGLPEPIGRWWLAARAARSTADSPAWLGMARTRPRRSLRNCRRRIASRNWGGRSKSAVSTATAPSGWSTSA
jgi:hypothetical protein